MATEVTMPQMGESIAEGTIVRWIKKVGDTVDRDEPLFEISTDKVDAEIPSPAAGVLTEIKVNEGETVAVNSVVAMIGEAGAAAVAPPTPAPPPPASHAAGEAPGRPRGGPGEAPVAPRAAEPPPPPPPSPSRNHGSTVVAISDGASKRVRSSPLVRRIAREHNVDVSTIPGSGLGGRVTKNDILGHVRNQETRIRMQPGPAVSLARGPAEPPPAVAVAKAGDSRIPIPSPAPRSPVGQGDRVEPLSVIRKKIAEHMVMSRRTSAHVHSVFHVNFATIERIRQQKKAEYEQRGTKLTYMAFITQAVIAALRRFPVVNASLDGDNIVYRSDINIGIAVALESGLIVPVIKHADEKNLLGLSRSIADLAERARSKQLKPDDVQGGTFTITNPGQFGSQFGLPIINQPQVAILGVGTIEKRPVVVDDAIAIRTMAYLTLGYDHRLIDGATGDQFMAEIKQQIEHFDANQV
jgi:pyruvate dehydrogenase E2 component (dihydrolipoyllysine-residue acetyltransferase)